MFLSEATAQANSAGGSGVSIVLLLVIWGAVFYFMLIKPQKKQRRQLEELHNAMEPGDNIMTTGGFYGTILDIVDDTTVIVEFGNNKNCRIPMHKNAIAEVEKAGAALIKDDEEEEKEDTKEKSKVKK